MMTTKKNRWQSIHTPVGMFDNVAVFDMTDITLKCSYPRNFHQNARWFRHSTICCPWPHRKTPLYMTNYWNNTSQVPTNTKILLNAETLWKNTILSIVGLFGAPHSRFYDPQIFNEITSTGQKGLEFISSVCKKDGHTLIAGDTDSTFIQIPFKEAEEYAKHLNKCLEDFSKQETSPVSIPKIRKILYSHYF